ncbi:MULTISPECIES: small, acid-soluble spore protein, alpha/beta type [Clostridium]|uniref:Small, acid-soluble spore protein, alpha/beta type n=1 Tax=Clostridium aquiflavi TaxID=3073603 RepID=A0ABU1EEC0_9CLOT|nr:small, acid-soluble spore protein, alpha/beta type [Clostridium sp. 5N-1]MDR5586737.1 small, acid-soluble spore protein, alpha/beta type [Clostridium sp. 5N-1]NFG62299.1 alpha/beta-type small acid-soluble spore protein [Clostridium botulinum]NFQ09664.1 alpha/beta-type small acid-soluble spore protein [Clostridium botulinum]
MSGTPLKKIIKSKIKSNKELTEAEKMREKLKYEIAEELGLSDKVDKEGWGGLSAEETGRIGGLMTKRKKILNMPTNNQILQNLNYNKKI